MTRLTCFKAYDIRGQLDTELDEKIAYRIGRAVGVYLKPQTMVVGGDSRLTTEKIKEAVVSGLRDSGVNVLDIGLAGTEEVYFATFYLGLDGGIEVTASHNPMDYNGMKLVRSGARPISGDTGLRDIQRIAEQNNFDIPVLSKGRYDKIFILDEYINHLLSYIEVSNFKRPMKLVFNSGNGAAGHVIDAIECRFQMLNIPIQFIKIHHESDGTFPNGIPNPLLPENRRATIDAVKYHGADIGIAFDGDFDRCFLFDHEGSFIEGYYIVGLLAQSFLKKNPSAKIVHDPRLTWNTIDIIEQEGGKPVLSKTGHAFFKERMRLEDAVYGGEMSAHHYFRDFEYCDSGMIPWLLVVELVAVKGLTLKQLVEQRMAAYPSSGEINSKVRDIPTVIQNVLATYENSALSIDRTDGISVEFADWRFNLRSSNTEPLVRLNVETKNNEELLKQKTSEVLAIIRNENEL